MSGHKLKPIREKFWEKVDIGNPDECWNWKGHINNGGYGIFALNEFQIKTTTAHRFAYMLSKGPIPKRMVVCHKCDNKICCNPNHLFLGTQLQNIEDMWEKGRGTIHLGGNKLTEEKILEIRNLYSQYNCSELARIYNVSVSTISRVINRRTWRNIS